MSWVVFSNLVVFQGTPIQHCGQTKASKACEFYGYTVLKMHDVVHKPTAKATNDYWEKVLMAKKVNRQANNGKKRRDAYGTRPEGFVDSDFEPHFTEQVDKDQGAIAEDNGTGGCC
ncbi:hypothetical protein WH96_05960 [Kiloniella spongiae]|uniref:Uncharacterized protein n=1 Tax=Kiloniella spongiae TaxID=1489064 RepID=A0A0H2MM62_9PROT|nr:hypothetical protein WH96_05960 [Kiloniella spongiae]